MKHFYRVYDDEETIEEKVEFDSDVLGEKHDKCGDAEELSEEEIVALKKLAAVADKLVELLSVEEAEHEAVDAEEEKEEKEEETLEEVEEKKEEEEIFDTDQPLKKDSCKSFGSLEKRKPHVDDSLKDDVSDAWAKRYGGKR